jgi:hypothetical protein
MKEEKIKKEFINGMPTQMTNEAKEAMYRLYVHFNYDGKKMHDYLIKAFKDVFGIELTKK